MTTIAVDSEDLRRVLRLIIAERPSEGIIAASVMRLCGALPQSRHLIRSHPVDAKITVIKMVVHHMGLGLKEARDWAAGFPKETDNADLARDLEAIGCVVEQLGGSTPGAAVPVVPAPHEVDAIHYDREGQGWQWVCGERRGHEYHRRREDAIEAGRKVLRGENDAWRAKDRMTRTEVPEQHSDAMNWRHLRATVNAYDHRRRGPDDLVMDDNDVLQVLCDWARRQGRRG